MARNSLKRLKMADKLTNIPYQAWTTTCLLTEVLIEKLVLKGAKMENLLKIV